MSLIDEMMSKCAFMNKSKVTDGEGGAVTTWTQGAEFNACIVLQNSALATIADAIKETRSYTITVNKSISLEYGDVVKRLSDGATFKVTSNTEDQKTPASASLNIAQVKAERWDLTT